MALSIKKRWEIIFLSKHPRGPKMNITQIGKELRCARAAVRTWLQRYEETGDVQDKEGRGRNRKTTERQDNMIGALMEQDTEQRGRNFGDIASQGG
jgi:transposase